jgi:outer membrane lipoprotein carrier protein
MVMAARFRLVVLLLCGVCFSAQSWASNLDQVLDNLQQTYDRIQALSADFVQVATLASIDREQTSSGRVYIQKPQMIRWEYAQPEPQTVLYKDNLLRIYTPKRQQVLQSVVDADNRTNVALLFLAGVGTLREVFTITPLSGQETHTTQLRLLPRSPQAGFTELHITLNPQSYLIESLTIHDPIGNRTTIHLSALNIHPTLPAHLFELDLPPGTEVLAPSDLSEQK